MNRDRLLKEMGLGPVWKLRQPAVAAAAPEPAPEPASEPTPEPAPAAVFAPLPRGGDARSAAIAAMGWDELKDAIANCTACELCRTRKQAVPGVGDIEADWLFVGEGPGAEEDERGEPFVGQAGKLLDAMLAAIDLQRGNKVYIANAVKCRPPNNRTPEPEETAACWPFLARQIELIRPQLIVALGKPAAQTLLQQDITIARARGTLHAFKGVPLVVTYHPAYLLRNLPDKAKAWEDLCFMRRTMAGL